MIDLIASVKQKQRTIQKLQSDQAEKKGSRAQLLKQLKDDHEVSSLEEAEKILEAFKQEKEKNEKLLKRVDTELEEIIQKATGSSID